MSDHLQHELKKEFQLERMILFSDAVFAIAITLLAIEIKVPELDRRTVTDHVLLAHLDEMVPKFVGFFISFMLIGLYWLIHHHMFGYVINYDRRLLWLNLTFLLGIVLMPFTTGFYSNYLLSAVKIPVALYTLNITFIGTLNFLIWRHISRPDLKLSEGVPAEERKYFTMRALLPALVVVLVSVVYLYMNRRITLWLVPAIPLLIRLVRTLYFRKRLPKTSPPAAASHGRQEL
jgi:uncharacterized membrane protein